MSRIQNLISSNTKDETVVPMSLSMPEDIFGDVNDPETSNFMKMLYSLAMSNANLNRIEFKETVRKMAHTEDDISVVYGDNVQRFRRTEKIHQFHEKVSKLKQKNLKEVVYDYIPYQDDHPSLTPHPILDNVKETSLAYFKNIGDFSKEKVIQSKKVRDAIAAKKKEEEEKNKLKFIPKSERVEIEPYDFVPEDFVAPLTFSELEYKEIYPNAPSSYLRPPRSYRETICPSKDQKTHPLLIKIPEGTSADNLTAKKKSTEKCIMLKEGLSDEVERKILESMRRNDRWHWQQPQESGEVFKPIPTLRRNDPRESQSPSFAKRKSVQWNEPLNNGNISNLASVPKQKMRPQSAISSKVTYRPSKESTYRPSSSKAPKYRPSSSKAPKFPSTQTPHQKSRPRSAAASKTKSRPRSAIPTMLSTPAKIRNKIRPQSAFNLRKASTFMTELHDRGTPPQSARPVVRNSSQKSTLQQILATNGRSAHHLTFPPQELQDSKRRVDIARKGSVFVSNLLEQPDLNFLFPDIEIKDPIKVKRSRAAIEAEAQKTDEQSINEISTLAAEKNRELVAQYERECKNIETVVKKDNKLIEKLCEVKDEFENVQPDQIDSEFDFDLLDPYDFLPRKKEKKEKKKIKDPKYWKNQFVATQMKKQEKLLRELDERYLNRRQTYKSRKQLKKVVKNAYRAARGWNLCRSNTIKKQESTIWKDAINELSEAEKYFRHAVHFYMLLVEFCDTNNFPETPLQKQFLDGIRVFCLQHQALKASMFFRNLNSEYLKDSKTLKLIHFVRSKLGVGLNHFFEYINNNEWTDLHPELQQMNEDLQKQKTKLNLQ